MPLNSRFVSLTLFSLAVAVALFSSASAALGGRKGPLVGGWSPISDTKAPEVVEIAKFAIDAHNKGANTPLKYDSVIKGESQVVAGMNYKLVIAAKDGSGAGNKYEAVVYDRSWDKFRQLTSFKQL